MTHQTPAPSFASLLNWIEGRLSAGDAAQVAAWAAQADEDGRAQIAWVQAFVRQSSYTVLAAPSNSARQNVLQQFEAYAREHRKPNIVQRLIATLTSASGSRPALAGTRGGNANTVGTGRQLVFSTDLADVILNIRTRPQDGQLDLSGQVLPFGDSLTSTQVPLTVQVLQHDAEFGITATNMLGEFAFEAMPPGAYDLIVSDSQNEIEIAPIDL
jgi:hypothetical protein